MPQTSVYTYIARNYNLAVFVLVIGRNTIVCMSMTPQQIVQLIRAMCSISRLINLLGFQAR